LATGYPRERIHFVKGMVEDTLPQEAPEQVALLRLDTDFYKSTKHELVHLYPRISRGGILILDDYGVFRGAQQATDEYFRECDVEMFLTRVDEAVRLGVKL
jgi:O-methyltransferase